MIKTDKELIQKSTEAIKGLYSNINKEIKKIKKNKKNYRTILKEVKQDLLNLTVYTNFFWLENEYTLSSVILPHYLEIENCKCTNPNIIIFDEIKKDKNFLVFLTKVLILNKHFHLYINRSDIDNTSLSYYFGNLRACISSYVFMSTENMTNIKLLNLLAYFYKDSIINVENSTDLIEEKIRLITTGVKYEKEKTTPINNINYITKLEANRFDLIKYVSNRVKIKYITPKNKMRKITITHIRKGHFRTLKDGSKIWIAEMIINKEVA